MFLGLIYFIPQGLLGGLDEVYEGVLLCVLVGGCEERTRVERPVAPATPGPGAPGDGGKARIRASFTAPFLVLGEKPYSPG